MSRFIVTGGAGLIGSNLVQALNARGEHDIVVVDHLDSSVKEANLYDLSYVDYLDKQEFRQRFMEETIAAPATVFHLGACSATTETDATYLDDNNTDYTRQLCRWCLQHGTRFIYASSAATYGDGARGYSDEDERTPGYEPLNLYGLSKHKFDLWALQEGILDRITGLKYFNVFGPREHHKGNMRSVVCKAYEQILETGRLGLFKSYHADFRDGEQERDFVYVKDAVAITLFFHDRPDVSGLFNCGTGGARTWLDLGRAVFAAMGREPAIDFIDMPDALRGKYQYHTQADVTKLRRSGCDIPFRSLQDGVADYVQNHLMQ